MAFLVSGLLPRITLVVLSANEALKVIAQHDLDGAPFSRVETIDGVAVSLFELRLLATGNPILLPLFA